MPSLLFEIGCEELPASACVEAEAQLRSELAKLGEGSVFVGPRRLVLLVEDLPEREADEWVKGPPEHLRDKAAEGFARKQGVGVADLEVRDGFLGVLVPGRPLAEALPERLHEIVRGLAFSKSMRWDDSGLRFARPVRWFCAKVDDQTVEGFGGSSFGHRFTHGEVPIPSARDYLETLRAADVEPDAERRESAIRAGLEKLGLDNPNKKVLAEVVHLAEWPTVLEGGFDERFLSLPRRVVETAMESHQRYFPLEGNRFALVANGGDPETVIAGNETVLEGRLEDASFTFERDVAKGIERLAEEAARITFVAGAGTYGDKVERLIALGDLLGAGEASREAARLAKADQAAELVREFPDLEGHIGAEYARLAGFPEAVCAAIDEQYLPDSAGGPLPETETGRVLAAVDKIDSLAVAFSLGQRPTGSRDPYGLRRAAIGLCRLALEGNLELDVAALAGRAHQLLVDQGAELTDDASDVAEFVEERLEGMLDMPVEFVRAARASGVTELGASARLAEAL
ncbi:MAG TPA: glycine--tRNA ligase subunit beta, partial [Gaiellaceae bacterium]|nr:glycine--tRNA ligase subunit beta [Gaiellaceae bacterium]